MTNNSEAGEKLTAFADRIERLMDDIDALRSDMKDLKSEVKNDGFNVRALVKLVTVRRNRRTAEVESELLNDFLLYAHATGTVIDVVAPSDDKNKDDHDDDGVVTQFTKRFSMESF